ncbi:hypothetical protein HGO97_018575 [Faecalicatena sp. AGMB00832]|uniref:Histidine kinase N-terminal 7TM region domain-containing protein n=3 Tax=Lachnospirales TaxID=3085636 RepID=A0ABS6D967_9FIRM|nr:hypothetical protein [Faecalicatena faecalis]HBG1107697.1 hypothetical protein [Clostridioides difficile]HBG1110914.1 hypothetical protein [Clostridioides difficile]
MYDIGGSNPSYVRAALYLLLFVLWGYSLDQRIIQKPVLHCLRLMAALILIWMIFRTFKYEIVTNLTVARYLWYLYYLPMLFIPLLGVYVAMYMGKPESYRLPAKSQILAVIPALLFLAVITNDLHQRVFVFKSGIPGVPDNKVYSHRLLYFACLGWMVVCMLFTIIHLLRQSRVPEIGRKRMMPFILGCVMLLYGLLYLVDFPKVRFMFGDMNAMFCLLYASIYESCIHCRMIQSNTGYVGLFQATTLVSCIVDQNGRVLLRSKTAREDMVCPQDGQTIISPEGMRISSAPIKIGYTVWGDNIRQLTELRSHLNANKVKMEENKKKLHDAYLIEKQLHELAEKNRIYDELEAKHGKQTDRICELLALCKDADADELRAYMKEIMLIGTYIKRSANLYFLGKEYEMLPQQEIRLTFDEAVRALNAGGTECGVAYLTTRAMRTSEVARLLELVKDVVGMTRGGLHSLFLSLSDTEMNLSVECEGDLLEVVSSKVTACMEEGLWLIRTQIGGGDNG